MKKEDFLFLLDELIEVEPGTLTGKEILRDLESFDSLAVVGFIAMVDEKFDVILSPNQIPKCEKVDDLIGLLGDKIIP